MSRLKQQIAEFGVYLDQWERTTGVECPDAMAAIHLDRIRAGLNLPAKTEVAPAPKARMSADQLVNSVDDFARMCEEATGIPFHPEHVFVLKMAMRMGSGGNA